MQTCGHVVVVSAVKFRSAVHVGAGPRGVPQYHRHGGSRSAWAAQRHGTTAESLNTSDINNLFVSSFQCQISVS